MDLWIAPHNDDETLFGTFTLLRQHPLVLIVTDSWIQFNRGESVTADQRWEETIKAMKVLNCSVVRGGIRDDVVDEWAVRNLFLKYANFDTVYVPAVIGGNPHHDLIGKIANEMWGSIPGVKVKLYSTYTKENLWVPGIHEVNPTPDETVLKALAMDCYESQWRINGPHFEAVKGKKEGFA